MQTSFSSQTLAEIFRDIYLEERSGVLYLSRGSVEKRLYFDRGMILFAESSEEEEDLGRRLIAEGKISAGALAEARRSISEPKDLAQALVNRGLVTKEALHHTVRYIIEHVVESVYRWEGGTARFSDGWLLQEIFESDVVLTFEVILKGTRAMVGFEPIREALKGLSQKLRLRSSLPVPLDRLALTPAHGYILSRVDGSSSISDILSLLPPGEDELAYRFFYGLLVMGVVALDPAVGEGPFQVTAIMRDHADTLAIESAQEKAIVEAVESMRSANPHEILGLEADPPRETVERAYEEIKERFARDRMMPRVREKLRAELAIIESRLIEAYLTLSQVRRTEPRTSDAPVTHAGSSEDLLVRVEMDKTRTKMLVEENAKTAERYYAKARKFMREGDYHNAIQYGKLALSYAAEDARFYCLLAECQERNPDVRWQRLAEQNYLKATELDPWNAEYRLGLGRFYKKRGLKLRARKQFEEILEVIPTHEGAREELESLR